MQVSVFVATFVILTYICADRQGRSNLLPQLAWRRPLGNYSMKKSEQIDNISIFVLIFVLLNVQIINVMLTTTISDFRKDIKQYLDRVTENFETLIINRGKDSGVVIMSLDEYNSLNATYHELSSKTNEKRLDSAVEKLKTGSSFQKDLIEL
jgi:antitoxin YefM